MVINHLYTILCDYLVQSHDGKVSANGIFHNIEVKEFPAGKDPMGIVVAFCGDPGESFAVLLERPDGSSDELSRGVVEPPAGLGEHQQWALTLTGVATPAVFPAPGVYRVVLKSGDEVIHSYPFGVFQKSGDEEVDDSG